MIRPRLISSICFGFASLLIQPAFGHPQAAESPLSPAAQQEARALDKLPAVQVPPMPNPPLDHSGRAERGKASFYAPRLAHRRMADGGRFGAAADQAASKSLPLGTTAKVVNLNSGKSAVVRVEDRGPHVRDRVMDVSPKIAERLDMRKAGVAPVVVKPIAVPQPGGGVRLGAGAAEASPRQVQEAVRATEALARQQRRWRME
jgi:rare lipoprotein A